MKIIAWVFDVKIDEYWYPVEILHADWSFRFVLEMRDSIDALIILSGGDFDRVRFRPLRLQSEILMTAQHLYDLEK